VIFEFPSFEETVDNQTTFDLAAWNLGGSPTGFSIRGNSTDCVVGPYSVAGPCILFENDLRTLSLANAPAFGGPGTYTKSSSDFLETIIIKDNSTVPEPSTSVLLSSCLLGVGLVVRKRRFRQVSEA
jgi:hypothetical protein